MEPINIFICISFLHNVTSREDLQNQDAFSKMPPLLNAHVRFPSILLLGLFLAKPQ